MEKISLLEDRTEKAFEKWKVRWNTGGGVVLGLFTPFDAGVSSLAMYTIIPLLNGLERGTKSHTQHFKETVAYTAYGWGLQAITSALVHGGYFSLLVDKIQAYM